MSPRSRKNTGKPAAAFVCPECGKTFARAAALGSHRSRVHGIAGTSSSATRARAKPASRQPTAPPARATASRAAAPRTRAASASPRKGAAASAKPPSARRRKATSPRAPAAATQRPRQRASAGRREVNRDALLRSLFPNGIPAREDAIREVNAWLDQAERLARMR
jgi:hypothetical protein